MFHSTTRATLGYAAVVVGLFGAILDAGNKVFAHQQEHGTREGGEGLLAASAGLLFCSALLAPGLAVFGTSGPVGFTVKCKAAVILFAYGTTIVVLQVTLYYSCIFLPYFSADDFAAKVLIRTIGR